MIRKLITICEGGVDAKIRKISDRVVAILVLLNNRIIIRTDKFECRTKVTSNIVQMEAVRIMVFH